jgi:hypothetical protein
MAGFEATAQFGKGHGAGDGARQGDRFIEESQFDYYS